MTDFLSLLVVTKTFVLVLGVLIVRAAYRAYRRTGSRALSSLTIAFSLITIGAILGGGVNHLLRLGTEAGILINSLLTAVGFAVLAHSLYLEDPH
ncbi:MAG: hypothetical protein ABEH59_01990 [Halobacteriales archaeon]